MNPVVSIIIPTFNRENLLNETLNSIRNQTYTNWECIIIDDISTDASVELINNFRLKDTRFNLIIRPLNIVKGANSCRNIGIENAQGDYIMFFDSDDLLKDNCIENRVSEFKKKSNYDMLVFSMGVFENFSKPEIYPKRKVINYNVKKTINEFIFSDTLPWNICRPIYKSTFIKNKIKFNEKIHNFQDDEFNLRVLYHLKPKYLSIDFTDCYYRFDTISVKKYNNLIGYQNVINSLFEYYKTVFEVLDSKDKIENKSKLLKNFFYRFSFLFGLK